VFTSSPPAPILSQISPSRTTPYCLSKTHLNIIHLPMSWSSWWLLLSGFHTNVLYAFLFSSYMLHSLQILKQHIFSNLLSLQLSLVQIFCSQILLMSETKFHARTEPKTIYAGDLYFSNFAIAVLTTKGLGLGTSGSAVCIYICLTSLTLCFYFLVETVHHINNFVPCWGVIIQNSDITPTAS
jgi:hypothetical protein